MYPVGVMVAHGFVMLFSGVTLGVRRFGRVLTLRGTEVWGREYFLALEAGLAGHL
jgi:hypothetical protein